MSHPRTYTAAEEVVRYLSNHIMASPHTYKEIAEDTDLSQSTVANIASGTTRWPRPNTLFRLLAYFNIKFVLQDD